VRKIFYFFFRKRARILHLEYKPEKGGEGGRVASLACERVGLSGTKRIGCFLFT
jgi:hypothetical protein